jgi:hypothetical protein
MTVMNSYVMRTTTLGYIVVMVGANSLPVSGWGGQFYHADDLWCFISWEVRTCIPCEVVTH